MGKVNVLLRLVLGQLPDHLLYYIPIGLGEWLVVLISFLLHTAFYYPFILWPTLTMSTSPSYLSLNFMQNPSEIKGKHTVGIHGQGSESRIKS